MTLFEFRLLFYDLLKVKDQDQLLKIAQNLEEDQIDHKVWIEEPEKIPTCLVTKPYPKDLVQKYFKSLKLFK